MQLLGSETPSFHLVLFPSCPIYQDKSAHGMGKKPQNEEKCSKCTCWVGIEEKSFGLSQDQERWSICNRG